MRRSASRAPRPHRRKQAHPIIRDMKDFSRPGISIILGSCVLAVPVWLWAAKDFSMPRVQPALAYPAHDHHENENVTAAVDPYDSAAKSDIFVIHYRDLDLLPVMLIVTNDSDQPIQLSDMKAQLVTSDRSKLDPATEDGIYRRISRPRASGARTPIPFPTSRVKGAVNSRELNEIQSAPFKARAVEPRSTQAGFLFFDVSDIPNPLAGARFYLTGVKDSTGHDLMYFEIPLDNYLDAGKAKPAGQ